MFCFILRLGEGKETAIQWKTHQENNFIFTLGSKEIISDSFVCILRYTKVLKVQKNQDKEHGS